MNPQKLEIKRGEYKSIYLNDSWFFTPPQKTHVKYNPVRLSLSFSFLLDVIMRNESMYDVSPKVEDGFEDYSFGFKLPHPISINNCLMDTLYFMFMLYDKTYVLFQIPDSFLSLSTIIDQEIKTKTPLTWTWEQKKFWTSKWDKIREKYRKSIFDDESIESDYYEVPFLQSIVFMNSKNNMGIHLWNAKKNPITETSLPTLLPNILDLSLITVLLTYDDILHDFLTQNRLFFGYTQRKLLTADEKGYDDSSIWQEPGINRMAINITLFYRDLVDKLLCKYLGTVITYLCGQRVDRPIYILELSSGFGDFMEKLVRQMKRLGCFRKIIYYTVDSSINGVKQTRRKKRILQQQKGKVVLEIINLEGDAYSQLSTLPEEIRFDFIISEGSLLSDGIESLNVQKRLLQYLVNSRIVKPEKITPRTEFDDYKLKYNPRCFFIHIGLSEFFNVKQFLTNKNIDVINHMLPHNYVWNFLPKIATTLEWIM